MNDTQQTDTDRRLRESEHRFRTLFETMQEGFALHEIICNDDGLPVDYRFLDINPAFERLTGLTRAEVVNKTVLEVMPQTERYWIDVYGQVALTGEARDFENYSQVLDRHYQVKAYSPARGQFAALFSDITAQKKALREAELRQEQLRVLFESSNAGILLIEPDGRIRVVNQRVCEMFGCSRDELLDTWYPHLVHPSQRNFGADRMKKILAGEIDRVSTERRYIRRDGSEFWGYISVRRHQDADGRLISLVCHINDIDDMKKAQEELESNRRFLADIVEYSGMLIAVKSREGHYEMVNRKWEEVTGLSRHDVIGKTDEEIFSPSLGRQFRTNDLEAMENGCCIEREEVIADPVQGHRYAISVKFPLKGSDGSVRGVCVMSTDITDRKRTEEERLKLEQQILHTQKLESLGVLAGGIAHDFNNILMAIIGNADLALMRMNPESPAIENLNRIEQASARASDLVRQMLAYSGKGKFMVENLDMNILLREMLHILEVSISKKAVLRFNLHQPLPHVEADATQMRQIIMNLVINASEAIGDASGVITITTGCMDCDRQYLKDVWLNENISEGLYVYVEVADSGCGMDRETMARIFDPFFTTKFTGRGLGMAAVLGIVRGHAGAIKVYSELKKGTSFKILLPASDRPAELFDGGTGRDDWHGSGKVLLVDDEETVRGIGSEMLKELGFTTITANDGREAVTVFSSTPDISFVILDLTMPHMDGEQCFRELRQRDPNIRVIMSSGYNEQEVTRKFVGKGLAGFIQKPYKLSVLRDAIKKLETG